MSNATPTVRLIQATESFTGKQALTCFEGICAENCGAQAISMHLLVIPPGARAKAHLHEKHETTIFVLEGEAGMWYGPNLEEHVISRSGDFLYIPAGVPHLPYNLSDSQPCKAVAARTDPNEQESVVLLPELDAIHADQPG